MTNYFKTDMSLKDDEYLGEDGLIYCKNCNTRRSFKSPDGMFHTRCRCKCQEEAERYKNIKIQKAMHFEKAKELRHLSLLGKRYENSSFKNLDMNRPESFVKAVQRCKAFADNWNIVSKQGYGMYIFGDVGTGKTELTACIANRLINNLVPVVLTNFLEVSKELRDSYNRDEGETENAIISKLAKVDLLIIDDIGSEKLIKNNNKQSFMQEKIYDIINRRYINNMPTLFTSNYSIQDLINERGLDVKTADRIAEMSNRVIKLDGTSYREVMVRRKK